VLSANLETKVPESTRIYAIGDIHGRVDLLRNLHQKIRTDSLGCRATRKIIIYMGDYVDRGLFSREVIEYLLTTPLQGFESIFIKGNHEHAMEKFIDAPEKMAAWLSWGGDATLQSYGVDLYTEQFVAKSLQDLARDLREKLPNEHLGFLKGLKLYHIEGDYLFVHAGVQPGVNIEEQKPEDLMMIRDEFISSSPNIPYTVVFGHTIFEKPFYKDGKIGIDTGAYFSGKLTSVVLEEDTIRFLSS